MIKEKKTSYKVLSFYLLFCVFTDLVLNKLSFKYFNSEIYSYRLFTIVEFCTIMFFGSYSISNKRIKRGIWILTTLFFSSLIYDIINNNTADFDSIPTGIESLSILIISILLIYDKISQKNIQNIIDSDVIISIGFIIFFSGTFFLFILSQKYYNNKNFNEAYNLIVASFNTLKNMLITIGLIKYYKLSLLKYKI